MDEDQIPNARNLFLSERDERRGLLKGEGRKRLRG